MMLDESQRAIAECTEGPLVVDAGPGTGKTQTVVGRCMRILQKTDLGDGRVVMLTFTKNAAKEMRERLDREIENERRDGWPEGAAPYETVKERAADMFIGTFDSFCLSVVLRFPSRLNDLFGFDGGASITHGASIVSSDTINRSYFRRFLDGFLAERADEYPNDVAAVVASDPDDLYRLLERLMARGVIPLKREPGRREWMGGNYGDDLRGAPETLKSEILANWDRARLTPYDLRETYRGVPDLPGGVAALTARELSKRTAEARSASKRGDPEGRGFLADLEETLETVARDPAQEDLIRIVHDVYRSFIERCVRDDHLTFGIVSTLAFAVLLKDPEAREKAGCRYLIVDEFQDTNANQLMICLMILSAPNICVVGDWKQGIYGFRYATVDNILRFGDRVKAMAGYLSDNGVEVQDCSCPKKLPLVNNYRSSQKIIDCSFSALYAKGSRDEAVDEKALDREIVRLTSRRDEIGGDTAVEAVRCPDKRSEADEVLRVVNRYLTGGCVVHPKDGAPRPAQLRDIAVLCRSTAACRMIYEDFVSRGVPAFLQGDVEIMDTRQGKTLLAWLKYVSNEDDDRGFCTIMADLGYSVEEIRRMRRRADDPERIEVPEWVRSLRSDLRKKRRRVTDLISTVFAAYGMDDDVTQAITAVLSSSHRSSLLTISDLISMIESDIDSKTRYDIDGLPESNAVIIQTLHKSKGLEYPIVIIPNVDHGSLPSAKSDDGFYTFDDVAGLRCTDAVIRFDGGMKIGRSWRTKMARAHAAKSYDEERRLMFVGISRARQYVTFVCGDKPSGFFTHCAAGAALAEAGLGGFPEPPAAPDSAVPKPRIEWKVLRRRNVGVHEILRFEESDAGGQGSDEAGGRGMKYGTEVHRLAQTYAEGGEVDGADALTHSPHIGNAMRTIDGLRAASCRVEAEVPCALPVTSPSYAVTLRGVIDLIAYREDGSVEIHDWKTDASDKYAPEYGMQLSVYCHAMKEHLEALGRPDAKVECFIDWLADGRTERVEIRSRREIGDRLDEYMGRFEKGRRRGAGSPGPAAPGLVFYRPNG